jgi:hypothetical protein
LVPFELRSRPEVNGRGMQAMIVPHGLLLAIVIVCSPDGRQGQDFLVGGVQQAHRLTLFRQSFSSLCCHSVLSDPRSG